MERKPPPVPDSLRILRQHEFAPNSWRPPSSERQGTPRRLSEEGGLVPATGHNTHSDFGTPSDDHGHPPVPSPGAVVGLGDHLHHRDDDAGDDDEDDDDGNDPEAYVWERGGGVNDDPIDVASRFVNSQVCSECAVLTCTCSSMSNFNASVKPGTLSAERTATAEQMSDSESDEDKNVLKDKVVHFVLKYDRQARRRLSGSEKVEVARLVEELKGATTPQTQPDAIVGDDQDYWIKHYNPTLYPLINDPDLSNLPYHQLEEQGKLPMHWDVVNEPPDPPAPPQTTRPARPKRPYPHRLDPPPPEPTRAQRPPPLTLPSPRRKRYRKSRPDESPPPWKPPDEPPTLQPQDPAPPRPRTDDPSTVPTSPVARALDTLYKLFPQVRTVRLADPTPAKSFLERDANGNRNRHITLKENLLIELETLPMIENTVTVRRNDKIRRVTNVTAAWFLFRILKNLHKFTATERHVLMSAHLLCGFWKTFHPQIFSEQQDKGCEPEREWVAVRPGDVVVTVPAGWADRLRNNDSIVSANNTREKLIDEGKTWKELANAGPIRQAAALKVLQSLLFEELPRVSPVGQEVLLRHFYEFWSSLMPAKALVVPKRLRSAHLRIAYSDK